MKILYFGISILFSTLSSAQDASLFECAQQCTPAYFKHAAQATNCKQSHLLHAKAVQDLFECIKQCKIEHAEKIIYQNREYETANWKISQEARNSNESLELDCATADVVNFYKEARNVRAFLEKYAPEKLQ